MQPKSYNAGVGNRSLLFFFLTILLSTSSYALFDNPAYYIVGALNANTIGTNVSTFNNTNIAYLNQTQSFTKVNTFSNKTIFSDNITVSKSQTLDPLSAATAHININNPSATMQTQMVFTKGTTNTIMGGVRVDYQGNFNWHAIGAQGHQFYQSADTSNVVGAFGGEGLYLNPGVGVGTIATQGVLEIVQDETNAAIYITKSEHTSSAVSDISLHDSQGTETFGMASWDGGGSGFGYGGLVLGSNCATGSCRLGEISGKNQNTNTRTASIIFETDEDANRGTIQFYGYNGGYQNALRIDDSGTVQINGNTADDETAQLSVRGIGQLSITTPNLYRYTVGEISGSFSVVEQYDSSYYSYYSNGYYHEFKVWAYYDTGCGRVFSPSGYNYGGFYDGSLYTYTYFDLSATLDAIAVDSNAASGYIYGFYDQTSDTWYYKDVGTTAAQVWNDGAWSGAPDMSVTYCDLDLGGTTTLNPQPQILATLTSEETTEFARFDLTPDGGFPRLAVKTTNGANDIFPYSYMGLFDCTDTLYTGCNPAIYLYSRDINNAIDGSAMLGVNSATGNAVIQHKIGYGLDIQATNGANGKISAAQGCYGGTCQTANSALEVFNRGGDNMKVWVDSPGAKRMSFTGLSGRGYMNAADDSAGGAYNFPFDFDAREIRFNGFGATTGGICIGGYNDTCVGTGATGSDTTAFYDKTYMFKDVFHNNIVFNKANASYINVTELNVSSKALIQGGLLSVTGTQNVVLNLVPNTYVAAECNQITFDGSNTREIKVCRGAMANISFFNGMNFKVQSAEVLQLTSSNITVNEQLKINKNFTLTNQGTVWNDLKFPANTLHINPATTKPDANDVDAALLFDDSSIETIHGTDQTSHTQKNNTPLYCHIHWFQTRTGNVTWQLNYTLYGLAAVNQSWTAVNTSTGLFAFAGNTTTMHQMSSFPVTTNITSYSTIFTFQVSRLGTDTKDTMVSDAIMKSFDCHYEMDKLGSDNEFT